MQAAKLTVLVSVSNQGVRDQISQFVAAAGYAVLEAEQMAQAEAVVIGARAPVAVLITDGPARGAAEFISLMSGRQRWLRALVISAHPAAVNKELIPDERVAFIEKPFAWRELNFRLAECVNASQIARHQELLRWSAQVIDECERAFELCGFSSSAARRRSVA